MTTERPFLGLKTTRPQLTIDTEPAIVEIRQPRGELEIDNRPFRASYGLKDHGEFLRDCAELGRNTAFETIGRLAQEGDRMARVESGEDAIVAMATESNFVPGPDITWSRLEPPAIHYTARQPEFNPIAGKVNLEVEPGTVELDYRPGSVNIRMAQYASVKLWVTGDSAVDISA